MTYKITKTMVISSALVLIGLGAGVAYLYTSTQPVALEAIDNKCHKNVSILGFKMCFDIDPHDGICYGSEPGPCS